MDVSPTSLSSRIDTHIFLRERSLPNLSKSSVKFFMIHEGVLTLWLSPSTPLQMT